MPLLHLLLLLRVKYTHKGRQGEAFANSYTTGGATVVYLLYALQLYLKHTIGLPTLWQLTNSSILEHCLYNISKFLSINATQLQLVLSLV